MTYTEKANIIHNETSEALRTIYNALNSEQQEQLMKNPEVKALYERYGVIPNDEE